MTDGCIEDAFALDVNDELCIGIRTEIDEQVELHLNKNYTSQYKKHKKKNNRQAFTKVKKDTSNLACLKFDHDKNADGIIPNSLDEYLTNIDSWGWSAVLTSILTGGKPLRATLHHIFTSYEFFQKGYANQKHFFGFVDSIEHAYTKNKNPYHNSTHAADVLQTTHHLINATGMYHWLSDLELMAILFSAAVHDAEHTGTTNDFHVSTRSPLAVLYNDQSVLENHHLAVTWSVLEQPECNVLSNLDTEELEYFKELVTEMILATDMARHFPQLNEIKTTIENTPKEYWKDVLEDKSEYPVQLDKPKIMSLMIHAADISNAVKTWHIHQYTTSQLLQEFFNQGDMCKLRKMAPPPLCDRRTTDIPLSQINFAKFLVKPTFDLLSKAMRLLAEVFLPESQNLRKELDSMITGEMTTGSGTMNGGLGSSLNPNFQKITKFKKHSLRPNTVSVSAQKVKDLCDKFDQRWKSCMSDNTRRWEEIMSSANSDQEIRQTVKAKSVTEPSKSGYAKQGSVLGEEFNRESTGKELIFTPSQIGFSDVAKKTDSSATNSQSTTTKTSIKSDLLSLQSQARRFSDKEKNLFEGPDINVREPTKEM